MKTHLFRLTNFRGIRNFEITPKSVTAIHGGNGKGKTTIVAAFRSLANGGGEPESVMAGEEEATIHWVVEIMPGDLADQYPAGRYSITRNIRLDGYSLVVKNPKGVKITKQQTFVDQCLPKMGYDPIAFDKLTDEQRAEALKSILAVPVTAQEIRDAAGLVNLGVIKEESFADGVAAIDGFDATLEAQAKELRAGIKTLDGTIKNFEAVEGQSVDDVASELAREKQVLADEEVRLSLAISSVESTRQGQMKTVQDRANAELVEIGSWLAAEISRLNEEAAVKRKASADGLLAIQEVISRSAAEASDQSVTPIRDSITACKTRLQGLEVRSQEAQRLIGAKQELERWKSDRTKKAEDLERITVARNQLDRLRNKTLGKMPLEGMSIRKGRLYIGEVLSSLANTALRFMKWFEIASRYANQGQILIADNAEQLEKENLQLIEDACKEAGLQLIATFVDPDGGPLRKADTLVE